ncbi:hypothetical protein TrRE_jg11457 [Triparma retinervis]|uniref:peptidylprolyl isomerase n=1 Tax=Triparma retinervis TaxID=2557542 RepID=A0A9W7DKY9_9STRA|nr:hypothetical protein TrRE_jg11457 [Triparma retinervis]
MLGFWCRAVFDFISSSPQDLSFRDGDLLTIVSIVSRNWWHARNASGQLGYVPSNYLQVLPQYAEATMESDVLVKEIRVEGHESSPTALQLTFTSQGEVGQGGGGGGEPMAPNKPPEVSHNIVKTVSNLSQFIRELSRTFPEAGLPLEVAPGSEWDILLKTLHAFNSTKTPDAADAFLRHLITFDSMNGMLYAWLQPGGSSPLSPRPRVTSRTVGLVDREKMGREAILLHDWEGDRANGELSNLQVGGHVIIVHEQNDWAYCRSSPESTETGYVPLMYLRKIAKAGEWKETAPPVPPHIKLNNAGKPPPGEDLLSSTPTKYLATQEQPAAVANVPVRDFALQTTEAFASTDVDPNYDRLTFVVGQGHVTQAIEEGVKRLIVGDEAIIVAAPSKCYGDVGLPGFVSGKSYVIYEVKVLSSVPDAVGSECFGPEGLVNKDKVKGNGGRGYRDVAGTQRPSGIGIKIGESEKNVDNREQMPIPKGVRGGGEEVAVEEKEEEEGGGREDGGSDDEDNIDPRTRRGTSLSEVRDSLATNDLIKGVEGTGMVIGFSEEGVSEAGPAAVGAAAATANNSKLPVTTPPPPKPRGIRKPAASAASALRGIKVDNDTTPPPLNISNVEKHPAESTPPAPSNFPASFRRPNMPISPSDQVMSPVSKLYTKSGGEGLRMVMNRKSAPKPILGGREVGGGVDRVEGEGGEDEEEGSGRISPFMPSL